MSEPTVSDSVPAQQPEAVAPQAVAPEAVAPQAVIAAESPKANAAPSFADLPLHPQVLEAVTSKGYDIPTPIQSQIIPFMLDGRDVLAQSQTGTGKTAAFALPILSRIDLNKSKTQVLVLAPTRELAIQVAKSFSTYGAHLQGFSVAAIYGGQDYEPQLKQLRRGVHVVVGTPGRVIDHIKRGTFNLKNIDTLVLDEADEMLNMGFLEDVQFVLDQAPPERQVALFSATLPDPIRKISQRYLSDPAKITIKHSKATEANIRQRALFVSPRDKLDVLKRFLEVEDTDGVIVFTKTKDATVTVADKLNREGQKAVALNGDMPQRTRERTIENFRNGHLDILVATDVAARGLDVQRVSHVFNFDLPHDTESYVHRIGRTGRAGRKGDAIIFLTGAQRGKLRQLEKVAKSKIEVVDPPGIKDINARRVERFCERIDQVTGARDLTVFKDLIAKYAEESGKPMDMIAAALAQIAQNGQPFLLKDQPKPKREKFERREGGRENGRDNYQGDRNGGDQSGRRERREVRPPEEGMKRYRIQVGHRDGVKPGNIVGAIANEAGIDGEYIGAIQIQDAYTTVDLPDGMPEETFHSLQSTRIVGKPMRLTVNREETGDDQSGNKRPYGGGHGKSQGHKQGKGKKTFTRAKSGPHTGKPGNPKKKKHKAKA